MRAVILLFSFCMLLLARADAQPPPPPAQPSAPMTQPAMSPPSQTVTDPVPVPEPSAPALAYYRSGNVLWSLATVWGLLIPALFLLTGFSAYLRTWTQRLGKRWFFTVSLYFIVFSLLTFVLDLPLNYYAGYVHEHAYGLSNQTFGKWVGDALKGLLVGLVLGVLFLWVPYLLLRRSPRRWWLYTGLLAIPFLFMVFLLQPIWIHPLFNQFGPMKDQALEASILRLAECAGIEGGRVFEVEKSADMKALNAWVTGLGTTKRIVLWDTTIAKLFEPELLFVMGHEMGHYVLGHTWKLILFYSIVIIATLYAVHRTADWLINHYQHRFGFDRLADIASLPLLMLLFSLSFLGKRLESR